MRLGALSRERVADLWLVGVVAVAPLVVTPGFADPWRFGKESVLIVGAAAALALHLLRPCLAAPARSVQVAAMLFLLGLCIALPRAPAWGPAVRWTLVFAAFVVVMGILATHPQPEALARRLALALLSGGAVQSVVGIVQIALAGGARGKLAMLGTIGNSEQVAAFLAPLLLLATCWPRAQRARGHAVLTALIAAGVLAARSRGAWLAVAIALGIMWAPLWRRHLRQVVAAGVALVLAVVVAHAWRWLPRELTSLHTLKGRVLIWTIAAQKVGDSYGLGLGPEGLRWGFLAGQRALFASGEWEAYRDNAALVARAHNELLDFAVEGGALTALGLVAILALALGRAWRRRHEPATRPYAAALVTMCLHALVSFPFHVIPSLLVAAVCGGALLAPTALPLRVARTPKGRRLGGWLAALAAAMLVSMESFAWSAQWQHGRALRAIERGDLIAAESALARVLASAPGDDRAQLTQAQLYYETRRLPQALRVLDELERRGLTIDVSKLKARILMDLGRFGEAILVLTVVAEAYPNHVTPRFDLGRAYLALGRRDEARAAFAQAIARRAKSAKGRLEQTRARQYLDALAY